MRANTPIDLYTPRVDATTVPTRPPDVSSRLTVLILTEWHFAETSVPSVTNNLGKIGSRIE